MRVCRVSCLSRVCVCVCVCVCVVAQHVDRLFRPAANPESLLVAQFQLVSAQTSSVDRHPYQSEAWNSPPLSLYSNENVPERQTKKASKKYVKCIKIA